MTYFYITCPKGEKVDMRYFIMLQMKGEMTWDEVLKQIAYYKRINPATETIRL